MLNNKQQRQEQQAHEEDVLSHFLESTKEFFAQNWLHVILMAAIIGGGIVIWQLYVTRHSASAMAAWSELGSVPAGELTFIVEQPQQAEQLRKEAIEVTQDALRSSPHSSATRWALLQLGSLQADSDQWKAAAGSFSDLTAGYPTGEPIQTARAALATCLESQGEYKKAADLYEALARSGQPYQLLSAARCRELAGEPSAAKKLYEKLRDMKGGDQDLKDIAQARLSDIALGQPLPPPPPVQPQAVPVMPALPSKAPAAPAGAKPAVPAAPAPKTPSAPAARPSAPAAPAAPAAKAPAAAPARPAPSAPPKGQR